VTKSSDSEFKYGGYRVVAQTESDNGLRARDDAYTSVVGTPGADIQEALHRLAATRGFIDGTFNDDEFKRIMGSATAYQFVDYMLLVTMLNVSHHAKSWSNLASQGGVTRRFVELILERTLYENDDTPDKAEAESDDVVRYHGPTPTLRPPKSTTDVELPKEDTVEST
jgi:hypothetical protein